MSTIRIYSKKAFSLGPGATRANDSVEEFVTVPNSFQDMPEKFANCSTFKTAVKTGSIVVIEKKATTPVDVSFEDANDDATTKDEALIQEYYAKLKAMKNDELYAEAKKYNVEKVDGERTSTLKRRVFEAFKISIGYDPADTDDADNDTVSSSEQ